MIDGLIASMAIRSKIPRLDAGTDFDGPARHRGGSGDYRREVSPVSMGRGCLGG
jgi:hypothetical protein